MTLLLLVVFWTMQVLAYVSFKYGSLAEAGNRRRWLVGFLTGNLIGVASMHFMMKIYEAMPANANVALVLATGGAFIGIQLALSLLFRTRLTTLQWFGIAMVAAGSALATLGGPGAGG